MSIVFCEFEMYVFVVNNILIDRVHVNIVYQPIGPTTATVRVMTTTTVAGTK